MIYEWVFYNYDNDGIFDEVLSRLDWQQKSLFYAGASGTFNIDQRVYFGIGAWFAFPGYAGYMEDRDWDWVHGTGEYSVYSISDNIRNHAILTDLNVGMNLLHTSTLMMNIMIGFAFRQFSMYSRDTWVEEPPGSSPILVAGRTIDYEVNFSVYYAALETAWSPGRILTIDAFIAISPFLTFVYDRDQHYSPLNYFQDLPYFGWTISSVISLCIKLSDSFDIRIKTNMIFSPPFKGSTYTNGAQNLDYQGGSSLFLGGISVSTVFKLGKTTITKTTPPDSQRDIAIPH